MEANDQGTSGAIIEASGNDANDSAEPKKDTVAYETYRKTVASEKNAKEQARLLGEKVQAYEAEKKQREETELKEKQDWKKLVELREQELTETKSKLLSMSQQTQTASKLESFLGTVEGVVPKKFWGLLPIDDIVVDPSSGEVDAMSVTKAVEKFKKEYPEVIQRPGGPKVSYDAPRAATMAESKDEIYAKLAQSKIFGR